MTESNGNWTALLAEMTTYRQNNMDSEWPTAQNYADKTNPTWKNFKTNDFWYRYKVAKDKVDKALGRKYN